MKNKIRENLILIVILVLLVTTVRVEAAQQKAYMIRNGRLCDMNGSAKDGRKLAGSIITLTERMDWLKIKL